MENCNCNQPLHEVHELNKANFEYELEEILKKIKCADWAKIYGNICENKLLMSELNMLKNNILWKDLKGCIQENKDLMDLLNEIKESIQWSDIHGDVSSSPSLVAKIKALISLGLESNLFKTELIKRLLEILNNILEVYPGKDESEIYNKLIAVLNKYFTAEEHVDNSEIYTEIIIGLTHLLFKWIEGNGSAEVENFLDKLVLALLKFLNMPKNQKYVKELWDLLLNYLRVHPEMTEQLWDILLDYLVKYPAMSKKLWKILLDYLATDDELAQRLWNLLMDFLVKFPELAKRLWQILLSYLVKFPELAKELWKILLDFLETNHDELDRLLKLLLKRLLKIQNEDPDNEIILNLIELIKNILAELKLNDLGDVNISNIPDDGYEYHLTFDRTTNTWVNTPHTWYGPKSKLPTTRICGVLYYVTD